MKENQGLPVMRCYVAGPMRGYPEMNHAAFAEAEKRLLDIGIAAISPHRAPALSSPEEYMRYDLALLIVCDSITLLPGWENSVGARCEVAVALTLGLRFVDCLGLPVAAPSGVNVAGGYKSAKAGVA